MMKIFDHLNESDNEGADTLPSAERRSFLKMGLKVSGVFLSGSLLSLTSVGDLRAELQGVSVVGTFTYKPHYSMVILQDRCINCKSCVEACVRTNSVPSYGYRLTVLERESAHRDSRENKEFLPVLCNQCNHAPCARVCPTKATYKDEKTGIVLVNDKLCVGCKACMTACPYNARYYDREKQAVDKCDFCFQSRLSQGKSGTACSEACFANALIFGDLTDQESQVYKLVHAPGRTVWVLRPELGTKPYVFYLRGKIF